MGEKTQDDVCHILGDEDDADEASETADEAEVDAEWDVPTARAEPAASFAGGGRCWSAVCISAVARWGNEQIYCAADRSREGLVDSHRSNDGRMTDQKNSPISKNHDSGNITEVCLFIIIFGSAKTEPAPATINFGTGLPQTRFRERIW